MDLTVLQTISIYNGVGASKRCPAGQVEQERFVVRPFEMGTQKDPGHLEYCPTDDPHSPSAAVAALQSRCVIGFKGLRFRI